MKYIKSSKGYFYKEYKSGKKVRISKEKYLKLKKNKTTSKKIIIKQKGGERPCIVCKRQGQITNLDEKSFFKTTPVKHRCRICEMRYDNENEKKKQVFCGKKTDIGKKICMGKLGIETTCGVYHCKIQKWICNNCIKDYNISLLENNIQEILNKGNQKFTKVQSIIRRRLIQTKKYNLRTNSMINFLKKNSEDDKINAYLMGHGSIIFNENDSDIFFNIPHNITFLRSTLTGGHEYMTYESEREKTIINKLHNMNNLYKETNINGEKVCYLSENGKKLQDEIRKVIIENITKPYNRRRNRITQKQVNMGFHNEKGAKSRIMIHSPGTSFPKTGIHFRDDSWIKQGIFIWNKSKKCWERFIIKKGKLIYIETFTINSLYPRTKHANHVSVEENSFIESYIYKENEINQENHKSSKNKLIKEYNYNKEDLTLEQILNIISEKFKDKSVNFYSFSCLVLEKTNQTQNHLKKLRKFEKEHLNKVWQAQGKTTPRNMTRSVNTNLDYYNKFFELNYSNLIQKDKNLLRRFEVTNNATWNNKRLSFGFIKDICSINPYLKEKYIKLYDMTLFNYSIRNFLEKLKPSNYIFFDKLTYTDGSFFNSTKSFTSLVKLVDLNLINKRKTILYNETSLYINSILQNYEIGNKQFIDTYRLELINNYTSWDERVKYKMEEHKLFSKTDYKIYASLNTFINESEIYTLKQNENISSGIIARFNGQYIYILLISTEEYNLFKIIYNEKHFEFKFSNVEKFQMIKPVLVGGNTIYLINYNSKNIDVYSLNFDNNTFREEIILEIKLHAKLKDPRISKILFLDNIISDYNIQLFVTYLEKNIFQTLMFSFNSTENVLKNFIVQFNKHNDEVNEYNYDEKYIYRSFNGNESKPKLFQDEIRFMKYCIVGFNNKDIIFCYLKNINILLILDENLNIQGKYLLDIYIDNKVDDSILCDINIINYKAELIFNKNGNFHTRELTICSECCLSFKYDKDYNLRCNKCNSINEN
jgi:hypothetical protein